MRKLIPETLSKSTSKYYIRSGILLIGLLFLYGILGSHFIMNLNFVDSFYYTIITLSTVGYGDYIPTTQIQKIFSATLALSGIGILAYTLNIILTNFQNRMSKYSKGARKMRRIKNMDGYYILCGYGRVGKVVYHELNLRKENIIIFEKDTEKTENLNEKNVVVINDDATENDLMAKLANDKCKSVIISTGSDVTNLFVVLTIRETNPDAWIVSRASKLENISRLKKAGADEIVSPEIIGGKDLYLESVKPHLLRLTVQHSPDVIYDEFKTIIKYGCTVENIDYHLPGIETPLKREIKTRDLESGRKYVDYLKTYADAGKALKNLYRSVDNIHSHLISCPNHETTIKLTEELEKLVNVIGKNLSDEEIAEITKKNIE